MPNCDNFCDGYKELKIQLEEGLRGSWFVPKNFERRLVDYCKEYNNHTGKVYNRHIDKMTEAKWQKRNNSEK